MSSQTPTHMTVSTKQTKEQRYGLFNVHSNKHLDDLQTWLSVSPVKPMLLEGNAGVGRGFALEASSFQYQSDNKPFQIIRLDANLLDQSAASIIQSIEQQKNVSEKQQALWAEIKNYAKDAQLQNDSGGVGFAIVLQAGLLMNVAELMWNRFRQLDTQTIKQSPDIYLSDMLRAICQKQHLILHIDHAEANIHSASLFMRVSRLLNMAVNDNPNLGRCLLAFNCQQAGDFAKNVLLDEGEYHQLSFQPLGFEAIKAVLLERNIHLADEVIKLLLTYGDTEQQYIYPSDLASLLMRLQQHDLLLKSEQGYRLADKASNAALLACIGQPVLDAYHNSINSIDDKILRQDVKRYMALAALCGEHAIPQMALLYCMGIEYHADDKAQDCGDRILDTVGECFSDNEPCLLTEYLSDIVDSRGKTVYCYAFNYSVMRDALLYNWTQEELQLEAKELLEQLAKLLPTSSFSRNSLFWHLAQLVGGEVKDAWFAKLYQHVMAEYLPVYEHDLRMRLEQGRVKALDVVKYAMQQRHYLAYEEYFAVTLRVCQEYLDYAELQGFLDGFKRQVDHFYGASSYPESLLVLKRLELLVEQLGLMGELSWVYWKKGQNERCLGNYGTALTLYNKALAIREELVQKFEIEPSKDELRGSILNSIGVIYDNKGDYTKALSYLKQSLVIQQEIGDKSGEGRTLNNI